MTTDPLKPLLDLLLQAIAHHTEGDGGSSDAELQAVSEALWPLVIPQARQVMKDKPGGLNISSPSGLACDVMEKLFAPGKDGIVRILKFKGSSVGQLVNFVKRTLVNELIDDQRKLYGRKGTTASDEDGGQASDDREVDEGESGENEGDVELPEPRTREQLSGLPKVDTHLPRVYVFVDVVDDEGNEFLPSERRSATGYLLLKQTKKHLHDYLKLIPGSVVLVPYGPRSKKQGLKTLKLTANHAALLRVWMSGEGDEQWKVIAAQMGTAVGNVKRWWAEAVAAFQVDDSPEAQALRSLYRLNPNHTRRASDAMDEPEDDVDGDGAVPV